MSQHQHAAPAPVARIAPHTKPRWKPDEDAELRRLCEVEKLSFLEVCRALGRPYRTVYDRAQRLGIQGAKKARVDWPEADVAKLRDLHARGATISEMADALPQWSKRIIYGRLEKLRLKPHRPRAIAPPLPPREPSPRMAVNPEALAGQMAAQATVSPERDERALRWLRAEFHKARPDFDAAVASAMSASHLQEARVRVLLGIAREEFYRGRVGP